MEKIIDEYLNENYGLTTYDEGSKRLCIIRYDVICDLEDQTIKRGNILKREINEIFGVEEYIAQIIIDKWSKSLKSNVDLKNYWNRLEIMVPNPIRIPEHIRELYNQPIDLEFKNGELEPIGGINHLTIMPDIGIVPSKNGKVYSYSHHFVDSLAPIFGSSLKNIIKNWNIVK